jgi:hypothetical protein
VCRCNCIRQHQTGKRIDGPLCIFRRNKLWRKASPTARQVPLYTYTAAQVVKASRMRQLAARTCPALQSCAASSKTTST